jgi:hypothetical protein
VWLCFNFIKVGFLAGFERNQAVNIFGGLTDEVLSVNEGKFLF